MENLKQEQVASETEAEQVPSPSETQTEQVAKQEQVECTETVDQEVLNEQAKLVQAKQEQKKKYLIQVIMKKTGYDEEKVKAKMLEHNNNPNAVMNEYRLNYLKEIIMRQTDYDDETATNKLKEFDNNVDKVLYDYMGIKPKEKTNKIEKSINQQIYSEIRSMMDNASIQYEKQKKINQAREEYIARAKEEYIRQAKAEYDRRVKAGLINQSDNVVQTNDVQTQ